MEIKNLILVKFILSIFGLLVGYVLSESYKFGLCAMGDVLCHYPLERIGDAVFYGFGALTLIFAVLFFTPQAFQAWKKFAVWYIPLAALLFMFYPDPGSGDIISPYPETVFTWVSGLYVLISVGIIGMSLLKKQNQ